MKKTINEAQNEIINEFLFLENQEEKYNYLIELGKKLPLLEEENKKEENKVKGCQSTVWLIAEWHDSIIYFKAESDTVIVKGLLSLLIRILSEQKPEAILNADLYFIEKIGIPQLISVNRSNGLQAMIKQMKIYALAFQTKYEIK